LKVEPGADVQEAAGAVFQAPVWHAQEDIITVTDEAASKGLGPKVIPVPNSEV
jgi:hypothetical protein